MINYLFLINCILDNINQQGGGSVNIQKRSNITIMNGPPKKKTKTSIITQDSSLNNSHVVLNQDVSSENSQIISISDELIEEMIKVKDKLKNAKIQLGMRVEFMKESDDIIKAWNVSNKAVKYTETFIEEGVLKLKNLMENYAEGSSGWKIHRILEIHMTINKYVEIINLSGIFNKALYVYFKVVIGHGHIKTPESLINSHAVVNVVNKDNKCFLYSILSIDKYDEIKKNRNRTIHYQKYFKLLDYDENWFPMQIKDIPKFEKRNPKYGINVLIYKDNDNLKAEEHFKNPNVDIIYRSCNSTVNQIYMILLTEGIHFLIIICILIL